MPAAIVTGSSRGIGRATALRFADDGFDIAVNCVERTDAAERTAEEIEDRGREAVVVRADVSAFDEASRLVDRAVEAFGGVDHVVNNAGIDQHLYTDDLPPEDFDRVMDVNVNGTFNVTKAALSHLRESDADPTPSITNVSSILAHEGAPIEVHYAASKAGVIGLTRSHALDFAPEIRVNAVAPGDIQTEMTADRSPEDDEAQLEAIPLGRFGQPEEVADAIAYLRDAGFVTGETLNINGGEWIG